ncbi:MAG: diaminobutyrate--2-oxoglutarate transaminase [Actinobacteria bacterium]|nr:diaminobutyrate--2-oxoglutarate transaminase [Actinomycetota bacterium]MCB9389822.1 diaminobutyrate--2-oxoglutarate transaminase [Acidimicrobiia bacterium]
MVLYAPTPTDTFDRLESEVRSYCRGWPTVFKTGQGAVLTDEDGRDFIDFFAGAGALNYGHNPPEIRQALIDHISAGYVTHSLDMMTVAKRDFLETLSSLILEPRGLDYKVMFPGPTGTNAVEAALKIARKVTGRQSVAYFTNGFHGMTLGALAVTGNQYKRGGAGVALSDTVALPFETFFGEGVDTLDQLEAMLADQGSGLELPAAVIVETVQAEGGVNVASPEWMRRLSAMCREAGVLLIVDDIQVGCGRTGTFFSFEDMDLPYQPDLICLSKSLSAYGVPFSIVLLDPRWDVFAPGEHNGTFRGHNLAFVTAAAALREWWTDGALSSGVADRALLVNIELERMRDAYPDHFTEVRGRGMIQGIVCADPSLADAVCALAFERGLLVETAGPRGEVIKILAPVNIDEALLAKGLGILRSAVDDVIAK